MKTIVFRNESGDLGFFQKDGDIIHYIVYPVSKFLSVDRCESWNSWSINVELGSFEGNPAQVTKESIEYFLSREVKINRNIIDLYEVKYPGAFYPRIMRENIGFNYISPSFLQDMRAYQNIQSSLDNLFNFIEPVELNLKTYSHKIRELLILTCTEVEYLLLKTLTENGYDQKYQYSTKDYIRCNDLLKLNQYEVKLIQYSDLKKFSPFKNWDTDKPTKSIPWYNAYNQVKHNRNDNMPHANLEHLLDAVSAIHILLQAQYGKGIFEKFLGHAENKSICTTLEFPNWELKNITAPFLHNSYPVEIEWGEARKYFEDYSL